MNEEERIRKCVELCFEAQMMDSKQYLRMMHDSTKRPWVGLSLDDLPDEEFGDQDFLRGARWAETQLKEKNT